mmetsp:Transcript_56580/g.63280  ORF Transcript_56580/g.63280 Transcript_56580/m.63280 type:complete len:209 (-) Transcript_56580:841-1467(-)
MVNCYLRSSSKIIASTIESPWFITVSSIEASTTLFWELVSTFWTATIRFLPPSPPLTFFDVAHNGIVPFMKKAASFSLVNLRLRDSLFCHFQEEGELKNSSSIFKSFSSVSSSFQSPTLTKLRLSKSPYAFSDRIKGRRAHSIDFVSLLELRKCNAASIKSLESMFPGRVPGCKRRHTFFNICRVEIGESPDSITTFSNSTKKEQVPT